MSQRPIADLLQDLASKERQEEAWAEFLNDYAALVYQVIRRFEADLDNASDCFQFVCERLIEGRSKKLRQFKPDGSARFTTWLRAVVRNLCIDWHRKKFGRYRRFDSIAGLSAFDQEVFRLVYECGTPMEQTLSLLTADFHNVTESRLAESKSRIEVLLTPNQRWLLAQRAAQLSHGQESSEEIEAEVLKFPDPRPNPETQAYLNERSKKLERALASLTDQEQLLVRMRFEQELTLDQAAKLLGLGNAQRADRRLKDILAKLSNLMS